MQQTALHRADAALETASIECLTAAVRARPDAPLPLYYLGVRLGERGDLAHAEAAFSRAAPLAPDDTRLWLAWAGARAALNKEADAIRILQGHLLRRPESSEAHLALARLYHRRQERDKAAQEAETAARLDPTSLPAWRLFADDAEMAQRLPQAETALRTALALSPQDATSHRAMGDFLLRRKRPAEAVVAFRDAVRLAPDDARAHRALGEALLSAGTTSAGRDAAYQSLLASERLDPNDPNTHLLLGACLARLGRWRDAKSVLARIDDLPETTSDTRLAQSFQLGQVYRHLGDTAGARQADTAHQRILAYRLRRQRAEDPILQAPTDPAPRLALARLCADNGDIALAAAVYRKLLQIRPDTTAAQTALTALETAHPVLQHRFSSKTDAPSLLQQGLDAEAAGRTAEAFSLLTRAATLDPNLGPAQRGLARYYRAAGLTNEARRRLEALVSAAPTDAASWHELGQVRTEGEQPQRAVEAYRQAIALRPDDPVFRLDLADALSDAGLLAEAEATYRKALALAPDSAEAKARLGGFLVGNAPDAERLTEARGLLTDAATKDQANDYALFRLGQCELRQGSVKEGTDHLERLVARSPGIADAWYALSRARRNRGDTKGADAALTVSARLHREYAAYVKVAERVSAAPRDAAARLKLARSCVMRREMARALFHYGVCLELDPTNAVVTAERNALAARLAAAGQMPDMGLYRAMIAPIRTADVFPSDRAKP